MSIRNINVYDKQVAIADSLWSLMWIRQPPYEEHGLIRVTTRKQWKDPNIGNSGRIQAWGTVEGSKHGEQWKDPSMGEQWKDPNMGNSGRIQTWGNSGRIQAWGTVEGFKHGEGKQKNMLEQQFQVNSIFKSNPQ